MNIYKQNKKVQVNLPENKGKQIIDCDVEDDMTALELVRKHFINNDIPYEMMMLVPA